MEFFVYVGIILAYVTIFGLITKIWFYSARWICNNLYSGYYYYGILVLGIPVGILVFGLSYIGLSLYI